MLGDSARGDLSPVLERKLGEEIMYDVRRDRDFLDDDPILEYLGTFGNALVAAYPGARGETGNDFYFFCVRDPMLNAFALPGGFIAVHSALLLAAQNESELASVLSHEIGHVTQRHIARMIGQQKGDALVPLAAIILAALASKAGPDAAIGVFMGGQGLAIQRQINFTREAERESDRVGFEIMNAAGFDASGMVAFFQRMQAATKVYSDLTPPWLMSHPLTSERITDIRARIRAMPFRQRIDGLEFYLVRSRARVLQDESHEGRLEAQKFFETQLKLQNRQQQAAAEYGSGIPRNETGRIAESGGLAGQGEGDDEAGDGRGVFHRPKRLRRRRLVCRARPGNQARSRPAARHGRRKRSKMPSRPTISFPSLAASPASTPTP